MTGEDYIIILSFFVMVWALAFVSNGHDNNIHF